MINLGKFFGDPAKRKPMPPGSGIAIGVAIGTALGVALHNIAIGLGLGIAIGAAFEASSKKKPSPGDRPNP